MSDDEFMMDVRLSFSYLRRVAETLCREQAMTRSVAEQWPVAQS